ncbi:anti-sigma factor domain-containing protein [Actinomycetospora cinnamomea]|uniref:Regulator of SigK n=1 Tax=Actinomycetospora cinnamomea TaxID=663609 RepID=A0A2U1FPR7_9PSEU|nr:anti-sigma factor [Actinomycetospora cinnamomea]PVZ14144.1 putative zinc finger protein [Actinomycetospora cinnamomea]
MSDDAVRTSGGHAHDHDALAVAFALHALDPDEERDFGAHLATCPACRHTVDETLETLGDLGGSVEPVDPPPQLRSRLLDAVAAEDDALDGWVDDAVDDAVDDGVDDAPTGDVPPTLWTSSPRRARDDAALDDTGRAAPAPARRRTEGSRVVPPRRRRATRWLAVAAAAAVVAAVAGLAVVTQSLRSERDTAAAQAQREAAVMDMLHDAGRPGVVHATLEDPQGAMVGMVVDDGTGPRVLTTGLDANATEEIYVLWGLANGTPRPLGTFDVAGQVPSVHSVPSSSEAPPFAGFALSLEPGRTAPASPTRVVASGQVGR